ncbi:hypothetical protein [Massilia rubra]|uniref:Uncharacterized protein n=1 Tax=Massilia rubra TaxID=2607910 RepID=A0ABX0LVD3_9BURK|nr:hypothetical protein [Massilia rubra]NHZ36835.1 hypothetical protein [Massilia rubra]
MTNDDQDVLSLTLGLKSFLDEAGWQEIRRVRNAVLYAAPASLGIEGNYTVALPQDTSAPGAARLLHGCANALVDVYGYGSVGDLLNRAAAVTDQTVPTRIVTRFIDDATRYGAIPLAELVAFVTNMQDGLYRCARFKMGADTKESNTTAQHFVRQCRFLQTAEGSFVAKVEVPITVLKKADSSGRQALTSTEICSSFFSAIHFINRNILEYEDAFDAPDTLSSAIALFDVELLESITRLVVGPQMESIEFFMEMGTELLNSSTGFLSPVKRKRAHEFLQFITKQLLCENNLEFIGKIVALRSLHPRGNKNTIRVVARSGRDKVTVLATLSNEQYQRAVLAYGKERDVCLRGHGSRLKTQIRLTEVTGFEDCDPGHGTQQRAVIASGS